MQIYNILVIHASSFTLIRQLFAPFRSGATPQQVLQEAAHPGHGVVVVVNHVLVRRAHQPQQVTLQLHHVLFRKSRHNLNHQFVLLKTYHLSTLHTAKVNNPVRHIMPGLMRTCRSAPLRAQNHFGAGRPCRLRPLVSGTSRPHVGLRADVFAREFVGACAHCDPAEPVRFCGSRAVEHIAPSHPAACLPRITNTSLRTPAAPVDRPPPHFTATTANAIPATT